MERLNRELELLIESGNAARIEGVCRIVCANARASAELLERSVRAIEGFVMRAPPSGRLNGLFVIDALRDEPLAGAFDLSAVAYLRECSAEDQATAARILNGWIQVGAFSSQNLRQLVDSLALRPKPHALMKTRLCRSAETGVPCRFGDQCSFAHSVSELRRKKSLPKPAKPQQPHLHKTKLCRYFQYGECPFADRCNFAHGNADVKPFVDQRDSFFSNDFYEEPTGPLPRSDNYYVPTRGAARTATREAPSHHSYYGPKPQPPPRAPSPPLPPPPPQIPPVPAPPAAPPTTTTTTKRDIDEWSDGSLEPEELSLQLLTTNAKRPRIAL
ncbi:hypothetical protein CTAYLR_005410 [Chrysophaeum taylorii]|uniref:C3H1-type domain-containing protein n=1 Tax=Chrysophaeum taylorii TaxID=2483200 RepID=A0AAD7U948_9STRA|nr:hypothetical protein CTAYLR_005410 [Chrysophaeum taylorii]